MPIKKMINRGEKNQYLITDSHEPIISEVDFYKVQQLLSAKERIYYKGIGTKSVFTSVIKCGICGSSFRRKSNRDKKYIVCSNHDIKSEYCSNKGITEKCLSQAFIKMCNKLMLHYRDILLPLQRSLQELNSRRFCGNAKILDIHKDVADLKEQRHVIARLRKRGFLDEQKYNEKLAEIDSKLAKHERELSKLSKADIEDATLEQLDTLIDCIESRDTILTEFDEELFSTIVEKVIVTDGALEFNLISGLKFCENI